MPELAQAVRDYADIGPMLAYDAPQVRTARRLRQQIFAALGAQPAKRRQREAGREASPFPLSAHCAAALCAGRVPDGARALPGGFSSLLSTSDSTSPARRRRITTRSTDVQLVDLRAARRSWRRQDYGRVESEDLLRHGLDDRHAAIRPPVRIISSGCLIPRSRRRSAPASSRTACMRSTSSAIECEDAGPAGLRRFHGAGRGRAEPTAGAILFAVAPSP